MKTLTKHADFSEVMDSTFSRPKYKLSGEAAISIESEINKANRNKKIKTILTKGVFSSTLTLIVLAGMVSSVAGSVTISPFKIITYPTFSTATMDGGYVTATQTELLILTNGEEYNPNPFNKMILTATGFPGTIIGKNLNTDTLISVTESNGKITFTENSTTITPDGTYNGERSNVFNLKDEYVVECVAGACTPGEIIIAERQNIIGVAR